MGTRSGDLDPGVLVHLMRREGLDADALDALVNRQSGLLGMSGTSADVRDLLARAPADLAAAEAIDVFCHEVKKRIGGFVAVLGGLDTLVFTGGIGERSAPIRARILSTLGGLGIFVDEAQNHAGAPIISPPGAPVVVRVMATDEERVIATETARLARREQR
jgi:acetate kinase